MSAPMDTAKDRQKTTSSTGADNDILPDEWMVKYFDQLIHITVTMPKLFCFSKIFTLFWSPN